MLSVLEVSFTNHVDLNQYNCIDSIRQLGYNFRNCHGKILYFNGIYGTIIAKS